MTVSTLIDNYKRRYPTDHCFDRETLKFFGERVSEMRILKGTTKVKTYCGEEHDCYVLSSLQRNHPCGARRHYMFFDTSTFEFVIPKDEF